MICTGYLRRGQMEVTLQEVRAHLGVQTQRPWSDRALALLGLFRWLILAVHLLGQGRPLIPRRSTGYAQTHPTFADVLACVRYTLGPRRIPLAMSAPQDRHPKPRLSARDNSIPWVPIRMQGFSGYRYHSVLDSPPIRTTISMLSFSARLVHQRSIQLAVWPTRVRIGR